MTIQKLFLNQKILIISIILIFFLIIFFPSIISCNNNLNLANKFFSYKTELSNSAPDSKNFKLGLECITEKNADQFKNCALITNQTGVTQDGQRNIDFLLKNKINIKKIFTPEHGLDGKIRAEEHVPNSVDDITKIPVISLYPGNRTKKLDQEDLSDIDTIIFDIQDCGMRHYTYITTMFQAIDSALEFDKQIVVLDRPNPLGIIMEGPLVDKHLKSLVSYAPVPLRHGMTVGELALYYSKHCAYENSKTNLKKTITINDKKLLKNKVKLQIINMQNYNRELYTKTKQLLTALSPNIQTIESCYGYSFLGLLGEINPLNIGVGTDNAFQTIFLPETINFSIKNWENLKKILSKYNIESDFVRHFFNNKDNYFSGLKIKINDINSLTSFVVLIDIIKFFINNKIELNFSKLFNKAIGTESVKSFFDNKVSFNILKKQTNNDLARFYKQAQANCFLYKPFPKIIYL